jgi:putative methyltransferase (TIGR04325 family)
MRQFMSAISRRIFQPTETLDGYDEPELIEVIFRKTVAYKPQGSWPEMIGASSVLDFGGGCGLHYKLARCESPGVRWAVVEIPAMIQRATELATDNLRFFPDIASAAAWLGAVGVMHSNSALQYTPAPLETLRQLCALRATRMLWQRLALSNSSIERELQTSLLGDNGPGSMPGLKEKIVRYVRTKIPEQTFLDAHKDYSLSDRGSDWFRFVLK